MKTAEQLLEAAIRNGKGYTCTTDSHNIRHLETIIAKAPALNKLAELI